MDINAPLPSYVFNHDAIYGVEYHDNDSIVYCKTHLQRSQTSTGKLSLAEWYLMASDIISRLEQGIDFTHIKADKLPKEDTQAITLLKDFYSAYMAYKNAPGNDRDRAAFEYTFSAHAVDNFLKEKGLL